MDTTPHWLANGIWILLPDRFLTTGTILPRGKTLLIIRDFITELDTTMYEGLCHWNPSQTNHWNWLKINKGKRKAFYAQWAAQSFPHRNGRGRKSPSTLRKDCDFFLNLTSIWTTNAQIRGERSGHDHRENNGTENTILKMWSKQFSFRKLSRELT